MQPTLAPSTIAQRELDLRRVRSENDLPYPDDVNTPSVPSSVRHPHRRRTHRLQRSDVSDIPSPFRSPAEPQTPHILTPPRAPDQAVLRGGERGTDPDTFEILQALNDFPQDLRLEIAGDRLREGQRRASTQQPDTNANANANRIPSGLRGRILVLLGQAGPDMYVRGRLVSFLWTLSSGMVQFVVIVTLLTYSRKHESPTVPGESEWKACNRPLGAWNTLWAVRVVLAMIHTYSWWRAAVKHVRQEQAPRPAAHVEAGYASMNRWDRPTPPNRPPYGEPATPASPQTTENRTESQRDPPPPVLVHRLSNLIDLISVVWFFTAHILVYTSIKTCRHAAPHLWWLSLAILCLLYFLLLQVFLLGLLIFIFWPVLYLTWNILLLCIGRHPDQRIPVKHEIGKLSKSLVEQIPLVLYIPAPPEEEGKDNTDPKTPSTPYAYPPLQSRPTKKRRFAFLRRSKKAKGSTSKSTGPRKHGEEMTWEDNWVPGDYPFVRLEGNRATCAVCLMDFDEPKKAEIEHPAPSPTSGAGAGAVGDVQEVRVEEMTAGEAERLRLEDAGEGPQPLRLLACGHVFHRTCIDPWLTNVSGRCPVCQRAVEISKDGQKGS